MVKLKKKFVYKNVFILIFTVYVIFLIVRWLSSFTNKSLENISSPFVHLENTKNIFFVESSSNENNGEVTINARQACSIESAAIMNPTHLICVIIVNNSYLKKSQIVDSLKQYPNIVFYRLDILEFSLNTPVELWVKSKKIYKTVYETENISDLLRFLLLWR